MTPSTGSARVTIRLNTLVMPMSPRRRCTREPGLPEHAVLHAQPDRTACGHGVGDRERGLADNQRGPVPQVRQGRLEGEHVHEIENATDGKKRELIGRHVLDLVPGVGVVAELGQDAGEHDHQHHQRDHARDDLLLAARRTSAGGGPGSSVAWALVGEVAGTTSVLSNPRRTGNTPRSVHRVAQPRPDGPGARRPRPAPDVRDDHLVDPRRRPTAAQLGELRRRSGEGGPGSDRVDEHPATLPSPR